MQQASSRDLVGRGWGLLPLLQTPIVVTTAVGVFFTLLATYTSLRLQLTLLSATVTYTSLQLTLQPTA